MLCGSSKPHRHTLIGCPQQVLVDFGDRASAKRLLKNDGQQADVPDGGQPHEDWTVCGMLRCSCSKKYTTLGSHCARKHKYGTSPRTADQVAEVDAGRGSPTFSSVMEQICRCPGMVNLLSKGKDCFLLLEDGKGNRPVLSKGVTGDFPWCLEGPRKVARDGCWAAHGNFKSATSRGRKKLQAAALLPSTAPSARKPAPKRPASDDAAGTPPASKRLRMSAGPHLAATHDRPADTCPLPSLSPSAATARISWLRTLFGVGPSVVSSFLPPALDVLVRPTQPEFADYQQEVLLGCQQVAEELSPADGGSTSPYHADVGPTSASLAGTLQLLAEMPPLQDIAALVPITSTAPPLPAMKLSAGRLYALKP